MVTTSPGSGAHDDFKAWDKLTHLLLRNGHRSTSGARYDSRICTVQPLCLLVSSAKTYPHPFSTHARTHTPSLPRRTTRWPASRSRSPGCKRTSASAVASSPRPRAAAPPPPRGRLASTRGSRRSAAAPPPACSIQRQAKSIQVESSQVKSSQVESSQSQVKSSQVESSQVESSQVEPSQIKSNQVKSSQVESSRPGVKQHQHKSIGATGGTQGAKSPAPTPLHDCCTTSTVLYCSIPVLLK